ncbi:MAG: hypothetical protein JSV44_07865 [Candidatus Zixiibacteriota bacterium]|nr:MAG: hypothetical protein JSV44_07865 [candidate division Zixibacteria bacterium]
MPAVCRSLYKIARGRETGNSRDFVLYCAMLAGGIMKGYNKQAVLPALVLGLLVGLVACSETRITGANSKIAVGPRLGIPHDAFDFGLSPQISNISHVFQLYSVGTDTVRILDIQPG